MNSLKSMKPSPSVSMTLKALTASTSPMPLSKAHEAALYPSREPLPYLLVSNFWKTHSFPLLLAGNFVLHSDVCLDVKLFFLATFLSEEEEGFHEKL
ncbi:hypothetical protein Fmac_002400 [Flemingia macrophylla]|uniref:Uncharacterized protein n=1 Tax=Flemingia macrophylla TaxID=520843 RepID=A0ABD1NJU2_9FABA